MTFDQLLYLKVSLQLIFVAFKKVYSIIQDKVILQKSNT